MVATLIRALEWTRHNVAQAGGEQSLTLEKGGLELARAPSGSGQEVKASLFAIRLMVDAWMEWRKPSASWSDRKHLEEAFLGVEGFVITEQGP